MKEPNRPGLWYRLTDALNAVVWLLPLPRRVLVRLSALVYKSPPMRAGAVLTALRTLEAAGVPAYCSGGWGVDAIVGEQTRKHRDLDIVIADHHLGRAEEALAGLGYREWYRHGSDEPTHTRIVVRDHAARVIDVHPVDLSDAGLSFAMGEIDGRPAPCLSAGIQAEQHDGYRKRRRDRLDMRVLRRVLLGPVTALIIPVADADAFVDRSARDAGLPPHVTVLFPFVPGRTLDAAAERELAALIERTPAFEFSFEEIGSFPGVVHLPPSPSEPFVELTRAVWDRWPDHPPFGGAYDEIVPHLTVAYGETPPAGLEEHLPLRARADEVWLMAKSGRRWVCRTRFPLGSPKELGDPTGRELRSDSA